MRFATKSADRSRSPARLHRRAFRRTRFDQPSQRATQTAPAPRQTKRNPRRSDSLAVHSSDKRKKTPQTNPTAGGRLCGAADARRAQRARSENPQESLLPQKQKKRRCGRVARSSERLFAAEENAGSRQRCVRRGGALATGILGSQFFLGFKRERNEFSSIRGWALRRPRFARSGGGRQQSRVRRRGEGGCVACSLIHPLRTALSDFYSQRRPTGRFLIHF